MKTMKSFKREMPKGIRQAIALALALVCLLSLASVPGVLAVNEIETEKSCSVTFSLDGQYLELEEQAVSVKLYRVAEVSEACEYTPLDRFGTLDVSKVGKGASAQELSELALAAAELVKGSEPDVSAEIAAGSTSGVADGLATGIYLVDTNPIVTDEYEYNFIPYLVSLPNNYYQTTGDDAWVYDIDSELKPEQKERYGDLTIEKTFASFNTTLGSATAVFEVKAERNQQIVYNDVLSLVFDATGTKTLTIKDLPAGSEVTVTEVYSGASYQVTSAAVQTTKVVANGASGDPAKVSFVNDYNDKNNTGSSIVNHFTKNDGVWDCKQQTDSTAK